jgi:hypothetical protein
VRQLVFCVHPVWCMSSTVNSLPVDCVEWKLCHMLYRMPLLLYVSDAQDALEWALHVQELLL